MTPAASRWTARGLLMAAAVVAGACSRSGRPLVSKVRAVDASGPVWSLPKECQSCLLTECEPLDSGSAPYGACAKDPICFEAFASFAACFGRKPLKDCAADVAARKQSDAAGGELLACFMHACFVEACELARSHGGAAAL